MKPVFGRWLVASLGAIALIAAACNGNDVADDEQPVAPDNGEALEPDIVEGELHECAEDVPLPSGVSVFQSGVVQEMEGIESCVTLAQSDDSVEDVGASYRAAFEDTGWVFTVEDLEGQEMLRLEEPECGFFMAMPGEMMGMGGDAPADELPATVALTQLLPCEEMPPPMDEMPPPEEQ